MEAHPFSQKEITAQEFSKLSVRGAEVRGITFANCVFTRCSFNETVLRNCRFQDCAFKHCDLSLTELNGSAFRNTRFEDSQLIGVNWTLTAWSVGKVIFKPVDFIRCVLNYSTFMGLNLKKITLSHCVARDVSFEEADLTQADCRHTDFTNSRFAHTNLTEADFTGATNYTIAPSLNILKKTKFSLPEAMSLLYNLDIELTEAPLDS